MARISSAVGNSAVLDMVRERTSVLLPCQGSTVAKPNPFAKPAKGKAASDDEMPAPKGKGKFPFPPKGKSAKKKK
jgi:hypothetical protein